MAQQVTTSVTNSSSDTTESPKFLSTGNEKLDELLGGPGIRIPERGDSPIILICGTAGTGKTTLALQIATSFADANPRKSKDDKTQYANGKTVCFYSLEQGYEALLHVKKSFGFGPAKDSEQDDKFLDMSTKGNLKEGAVNCCRLQPMSVTAAELPKVFEQRLAQLKHVLESRREVGEMVVFIDSLNALTAAPLTRADIQNLFLLFRHAKVPLVITAEDSSESRQITETAQFQADVVIKLTKQETGHVQYYLEITKSRLSRQTYGRHLYKIRTKDRTDSKDQEPGIVVYPSIHAALTRAKDDRIESAFGSAAARERFKKAREDAWKEIWTFAAPDTKGKLAHFLGAMISRAGAEGTPSEAKAADQFIRHYLTVEDAKQGLAAKAKQAAHDLLKMPLQIEIEQLGEDELMGELLKMAVLSDWLSRLIACSSASSNVDMEELSAQADAKIGVMCKMVNRLSKLSQDDFSKEVLRNFRRYLVTNDHVQVSRQLLRMPEEAGEDSEGNCKTADISWIMQKCDVTPGACFAILGAPGTHRLALGMNLATGKLEGLGTNLLILSFGETAPIDFSGVAWFNERRFFKELKEYQTPQLRKAESGRRKWWTNRYSLDAEEGSSDKNAKVTVLTFELGELTPEECFYAVQQELDKEKEKKGTNDIPYTAVLVVDTDEIATGFPLLAVNKLFVPSLIELLQLYELVSVWIGHKEEGEPLRDLELAISARSDYRINLAHSPENRELPQKIRESYAAGARGDDIEQAVWLVIDNVTGKDYNRKPRWLWVDNKVLHCSSYDQYCKSGRGNGQAEKAPEALQTALASALAQFEELLKRAVAGFPGAPVGDN